MGIPPRIFWFTSGFLSACLLSLLVFSSFFLRDPFSDSPEFLFAAFDPEGWIARDRERLATIDSALRLAAVYYSDGRNFIASQSLSLSLELNRAGHACTPAFILSGAIAAADRSRHRDLANWRPYHFRSFVSVYRTYRESGLSHASAIDKIVEHEKL